MIIADYQIAYDGTRAGLEIEVRCAMSDSFKPFGSLVVVVFEGGTMFYQPMVRYVKDLEDGQPE